jgi:hypothetical protein
MPGVARWRRNKGLWLALAVPVVIALFVFWPHPDRLNMENFDRITAGMTGKELEEILGPPGDYRTGPTIRVCAPEVFLLNGDNPWRTGGAIRAVPEDSAPPLDLNRPGTFVWDGDALYVAVMVDTPQKADLRSFPAKTWAERRSGRVQATLRVSVRKEQQSLLENLSSRAKRLWHRVIG